jgi:hypothetical protein
VSFLIIDKSNYQCLKVRREWLQDLEHLANRLEPSCVETDLTSPELSSIILQSPNCSDKGEISALIVHALYDLNVGRCSQDVILRIPTIGNMAPDVCWWSVSPTSAERKHPLTPGSICPVPNLWVEIAFHGADTSVALHKISLLIPLFGTTCTFVLLILPTSVSDALKARVGLPTIHPELAMPPVPSAAFPVGEADVIRAISVAGNRPAAPVMAHWPLNTTYENGNWLSMNANRHVTIGLYTAAGPLAFVLELNPILKAFS